MASRFQQGYYIPKNPDKYVGDVNKIRYMSSWELHSHNFFDNSTRVIRWSSESIAIPYIKPTDGRIHKYFPDYWVEYVNSDGVVLQEIIEVKPHAQTKLPTKNHKHQLYERVTYEINKAKWIACVNWCTQHGMTFRVVTEKSIFK